MSYYEFKYDENVTQFQYLPYLEGINNEYIDEFNKNILKPKFGYYQDQNNPNNYLIDKNKYINNSDKENNYRNTYILNNNLYNNLSNELIKMINYNDNNIIYDDQKRMYQGYLLKIQTQIYNENKRISQILDQFLSNKSDKIKNKININILLFILFFLFIIFIFLFNYLY